MRWTTSLLFLVLAGCYSRAAYVPDKADAFCSWLLECTDPAVIAYDGMSMDACLGLWGPVFQEEDASCEKFAPGVAKQCVEALQTASCPEDGSPVGENIPEVCDYVYQRCSAGSEGEPAEE